MHTWNAIPQQQQHHVDSLHKCMCLITHLATSYSDRKFSIKGRDSMKINITDARRRHDIK